MKNLTMMRLLPVALLVLGGGTAANAGIAYIDPPNQGSQTYGGNLALLFTVNSSITVSELGVFNAAGNGLITGTIDVGIYNTGTHALVTPIASFQGSYTPGGFGYDVFQSITPVVLGPGTYEVDAVGFGPPDPNGNINTGSSSGPILNTLGGSITFTGAAYDGSAVLDGPVPCNGCTAAPVPQDRQFDAGTFVATATPEPVLYSVLALGLIGLIAVVRRRKSV